MHVHPRFVLRVTSEKRAWWPLACWGIMPPSPSQEACTFLLFRRLLILLLFLLFRVLRLVLLLAEEALSVAELQEILGMGQSRISTQLAQLKKATLVSVQRSGKNSIYSSRPGKELLEIARKAGAELEDRQKDLDSLRHTLRKRKDRTRAYFDELAGVPTLDLSIFFVGILMLCAGVIAMSKTEIKPVRPGAPQEPLLGAPHMSNNI